MATSSTPVTEAMERLGEAMVANVTDVVARGTTWASAWAGVATSPESPASPDSPRLPESTGASDELARAVASMWVGGLRSVAVTAAAVADAAAILSCPPNLVEHYRVDVADQLPGRTLPLTASVTGVAWASRNSTGALPVVSIVDPGPIAAPPEPGADAITLRVRPSVAPAAMVVTVRAEQIGDPAVGPKVLELRLSPENLVLDR